MNGKKWTEDEINFIINNYEERGVDYVASVLNRTSKSVVIFCNRKLGITSQKSNSFVDKEILIEKMKISHTYKELLQNINKVVNGTNLKILKKYIEEYNISKDLLVFKIDRTNRKKKNIDEWLQNGTSIGSSKLKEKLYKEGLKERKCELCGQNEMWNDKKMSLILDHINGINNDNRIENLRIVCPNCNSTLPTHCKGYKRMKNQDVNDNIKKQYKKINKNKIKKGHIKQRKVERPPYEQLIIEINELGYSGVGRKYGVSDNAIRKWKKYYEK
jgi:hypothetical protein